MTDTETLPAETGAAPPDVSPRQALRGLLEQNAGAVGASLPSGYSQDRFVRLLLTAANTNPDLFDCDPRSFLAAGVAAAQLGLEPNDARGLAYLIPFNDRRRGKVVQLIVGYRGMLDLARRSGRVGAVHAIPVYRGDTFEYQLGLDPTLRHVPAPDGDENPELMIYVYATARIDDHTQFVVLTRRQVDKVRDQYARSKQSPWHSHYVEMACKTAIRRLCKLLPQTVEMAAAERLDERADLSLGDLVGDFGSSIDVDDDRVIDTTTGEIEPGDG